MAQLAPEPSLYAATLAWLQSALQTKDLSAPLPAPHTEREASLHAALAFAIGRFSQELGEYSAIVERVQATVGLNSRQLSAVVEQTKSEHVLVEKTASALEQVRAAILNVERNVQTLATAVHGVEEASGEVEQRIGESERLLSALLSRIEESSHSVVELERTAQRVQVFIGAITKISRQAHLLAINAAIESAHLAQAGSGFAIVAAEVRNLARSTDESTERIASIIGALRKTTEQVRSASQSAMRATASVGETVKSVIAPLAAAQESARHVGITIEEIVRSYAEQSAVLGPIGEGIGRIAQLAGRTATAARDASQLDLAASLGRASAAVAQYRLGTTLAHESFAAEPASLEGWILAIAHGAQAVIGGFETTDDGERTLADAFADLARQICVDQRDVLGTLTALAVAVARNGFNWNSIGQTVRSLRDELETLGVSIEESVAAANAAVESAARARDSLEDIGRRYGVSVETLRRALGDVDGIREGVEGVRKLVADMSASAQRAGEILALIDDISAETTLLAINAAIEAAHAGAQGLSFSVIADEIGKLATTTHDSTQEIAAAISGIGTASAALDSSSEAATEQTRDVSVSAGAARETLEQLRTRLEATRANSGEVATTSEQQARTLEALLADIRAAVTAADAGMTAAADTRRLELAYIGKSAHALAARRSLGTFADQLRAWAMELAVEMDAVFDDALARGLTPADCQDTAYREIKGDDIAALGRLFDVTRVPRSGFDPPKYATRYDRAVEDGIDAVIDRWVPRDKAIAAIFAVDVNGYCFGHYKECRRDWTGDYQTDLNTNRIKRFFEDPLSLRCARIGLTSAAEEAPPRSRYSELVGSSARLQAGQERPWGIFTYARDTGIVYNDLSVAIYARGERAGTARIIYDAERL